MVRHGILVPICVGSNPTTPVCAVTSLRHIPRNGEEINGVALAYGMFAIVCHLYGEDSSIGRAGILNLVEGSYSKFLFGLVIPVSLVRIQLLAIVIKYANSKSPGYAQSVEHRTINAEVAGSSPAPGNTSVLFF